MLPPASCQCCNTKLSQAWMMMDPYNYLTLPFYKLTSPSSESPTSSSSTSELFTPAGYTNEASTLFERNDGRGDARAVSTSSSKYEDSSSSHLDCSTLSSPMNIPSPIREDDLGITMPEFDDVDGISEDLHLDMKPCLDELYPLDGCCRAHSGCGDDDLLSCLDKFLESDTPQDVEGESGLASMNGLFPDLSTLQDFSLLDDLSAWSKVDDLQGLNPSSSEEESASQMLARWLQNNAHWVSLSDLRKIKLRTSTIENMTQRLGGGKKGLMLFLKIVLMWVQSSRQKMVTEKGGVTMSPSGVNSSLPASAGLMGTAVMTMEGVISKNSLGASESLLGAKPHTVRSLSGCGSYPTAGLSADWVSSRPEGAHLTPVHPNLRSPIPRHHATITTGGACSPLPSSNFYRSNRSWLNLSSNVVHGVGPSTMSPSNLQWPPRGGNGRLGGACAIDVSSVMMSMQQRQCADVTPAATTRAARKSRMERQRWSVRHTRKWAAATGQHYRHAAAATSSGYAHLSVSSWSQSRGRQLPKSDSSLHTCQQSLKAMIPMDHQQAKRRAKSLKLLFHKELKQSDVGSLGRIVLPKAAETCLPPLELRDGVNLVLEDMNSTKIWNMRYRFWPNNKSRMYLLENTSDFVKLYDLKEGDHMMMYLDSLSNRYVIRGVKGSGIQSTAVLARPGNTDGVHAGDKRRHYLKEEVNFVSRTAGGATNAEDSDEDSVLVELIEQSLEDLKDS